MEACFEADAVTQFCCFGADAVTQFCCVGADAVTSVPKKEAPTKEYVSVPADVNYMGIPDKKTTESKYTECAAVILAKPPPCCASVRSDAERGLKVAKHPAR